MPPSPPCPHHSAEQLQGGVLEAEVVFVAMTLLLVARKDISLLFPQAVEAWSEGAVAIGRVGAFLLLPETQGPQLPHYAGEAGRSMPDVPFLPAFLGGLVGQKPAGDVDGDVDRQGDVESGGGADVDDGDGDGDAIDMGGKRGGKRALSSGSNWVSSDADMEEPRAALGHVKLASRGASTAAAASAAASAPVPSALAGAGWLPTICVDGVTASWPAEPRAAISSAAGGKGAGNRAGKGDGKSGGKPGSTAGRPAAGRAGPVLADLSIMLQGPQLVRARRCGVASMRFLQSNPPGSSPVGSGPPPRLSPACR